MADDASGHCTRFRVTYVVSRYGPYDRSFDAALRLGGDRQSGKCRGEQCGSRQILHRESLLHNATASPG